MKIIALGLKRHARLISATEIFFLYIVLVGLLVFGFIPFQYKLEVLDWAFLFAVVAITFRLMLGVWTLEGINLRLYDIKRGVAPYGLCIALAIVGITVAHQLVPVRQSIDYDTLQKYSIKSSIQQEILYRLFLMKLCEEVFASVRVRYWVNVSLFTFMHCMYSIDFVLLMAVFIGGCLFTKLYGKYPNLLLICITHILFNVLVVYVKIFT
jgi:membrane protease YdiL (CAAX protease family)